MVGFYVDNGYALFPMHGGKGGTPEKWNETEHDVFMDPKEFARNNKIYGVCLKEDDLVIDIDPRNFDADDNPFKRLVQEIGIKLGWHNNTRVVKTPSGGVHIYLKKDPSIRLKKNLAKYKGLDFLSKGTYVVGGGSILSTEKVYQPANTSNVMQAPAALIDHLISCGAEVSAHARTMDEAIEDDSDVAVHNYIKFLHQCGHPESGERNNVYFRYAAKGRDLGLTRDKVEAVLSEFNSKADLPIAEHEMSHVVSSAYDYSKNTQGVDAPSRLADQMQAALPKVEEPKPKKEDLFAYDPFAIAWDLDSKGQPKKTLNNAIGYMIALGISEAIRTNEMTSVIEICKDLPWSTKEVWLDVDTYYLKQFLTRKAGVEFSTTVLTEAIDLIARQHAYHPVQQHLETLTWDGENRLDTWLVKYLGVPDSKYARELSRIVISAAVMRAYVPGTKFDYVLILEGKQGSGKSTAVSILGGEWYGDHFIDPRSKDTVDACRGRWIIEISEMEVVRRAEMNALKAFITRQTDRIRLPYTRTTVDFPRQFIFIGTINPTDCGYLNDSTGNRRFLPVYCSWINLDGLKSARDQIFAEAVHRFKNKQMGSLYINDPLIADFAAEEVAKRNVSDPWHDMISEYLFNNPDVTEVTIAAILEGLFMIAPGQIKRREQVRVGLAMAKLGWRKGVDKAGRSIYVRPIEQILQTQKIEEHNRV